MDPISASCFNLHVEENARAILEEKKQDQQFAEIIVSCRSLSNYEDKKLRSIAPQILATAIAASFHISVGIALAFSAILIPQLEAPDSDFKVSKKESAWIASTIVLVVPVGAIAGGFIMDRYGRLNMIKLAALPGVLGWVLVATAQNLPMVLIGRMMTGLASAFGTSPAIVYITEIARADIRGSLISCGPTYASLGMVIAFLKGWFLDWRTVAWICNIYTIIPVMLVFLIPESPVWLVSRGRIDEARKSLEWLNKYQPQPDNKSLTFAELHLSILQKEHQLKMDEQAAHAKGSGFSQKVKHFMKPTGYKPLLILMGLFTFQQFSGIYITLFYAVIFFEEVKSSVNPYLASILIGVVRFVMSMLNTYLLRRFRRRPLIMISAVGMACCMFISGLFTLWIRDGTTTLNWVPVVFLLLYVVTSMIGLLPIPWTMTAELFPLEIRGIAHSVTFSIANLILFASVQLYRDLNDFFGGAYGLQYFFAVVSLVAVVYTFIFVPETHGKKLSAIEDYFNHNTIYLGQKPEDKPTKAKKNANNVKKPIVKNSRASAKDYNNTNGQEEKMIEKV